MWLASLKNLRGFLPEIATTLCPEERQRAARFRFEIHRERHQLARGLLRVLLGRYLLCPARELEFVCGPHGKPALKSRNAEAPFHFNTSHSGDFAAFAVTQLAPVGVDIEHVRPNTKCEEIARRHFARGEVEEWLALPPEQRVRAFFHGWTRKEAFVKARGDGVFAGLNTFEVSLSAESARLLSINDDASLAAQWTMSELPESPECVGAVAVESPSARLVFWKMEAEWIAAQ